MAAIIVAIGICNIVVIVKARGRCYEDATAIPAGKYALVLGTSPTSRYGGINAFYVSRMQAAARLYHAGKVERLLVSGSDQSLGGVNEAECMSKSLQELGVPATAIMKDGKGYNTELSVRNALKTCGAEGCIIVSQEFHNQRALFIADHLGLHEATAYNATKAQSRYAFITYLRELLAKVKVFKVIFC